MRFLDFEITDPSFLSGSGSLREISSLSFAVFAPFA